MSSPPLSSSLVAELTSANDQNRSLNFVKKVLQGIRYVSCSFAGGELTAVVKGGGDQAIVSSTVVTVRALGALLTPPLLGVTQGSAIVGEGTGEVALQTTAAGNFKVSVTGTGDTVLVVTADGAMPTVIRVNL